MLRWFSAGALLSGLSPTFAAVKSVKSALVVMPPVQIWDPIQQIRRGRDKGFFRWMPHINMLYPFLEDSGGEFAAAVARAREALNDVEPFTLQLQQFHFFEHSRRSCTVWLRPQEGDDATDEDSPALHAVHERLLGAFPSCTDLSDDPSRDIGKFVPHLSVGGWRGATEAAAAVEIFQKTWSSLSFPVRLGRRGELGIMMVMGYRGLCLLRVPHQPAKLQRTIPSPLGSSSGSESSGSEGA